MNRKNFLKLAIHTVAAAVLGAGAAHADTFPSRPIRIIVPYSAGGLPDTVARSLAPHIGEALGQSVIVENRPGAGGVVAVSALAQAPADGHTLLLTDGPLLETYPLMHERAVFDLKKDFAPVALVGSAPLFLAVNPRVKADNFDQLIALALVNPGKLNYGSSGLGSIHHLTAAAMDEALGLHITHVPFKGSANSVPAMIAGDVDMVFASPPSLMGFVKNGKAKLIAVNSAKRSPLAPNIPTIGEKVKGFDFAFTVAILGRAGTPPEAAKKIAAAVAQAVRRPDVIAQMQAAGVDPVGGDPQQLEHALAAESERIMAAARHADLRKE